MIQYKNINEYKLTIFSEYYDVIDNLRELLIYAGKEKALKPYLYQCNGKSTIFVSKGNFEQYLYYLEDKKFFIRTHENMMTGKSIQLTYAGIPICIDSTLEQNEFVFIGSYVNEHKEI